MKEAKDILVTAINQFNEKEKYLIENNLSERCICSRLAFYIQQALLVSPFKDFTVDVEYNRNAKERSPKLLYDKKIIVDLIVHKRGWHGGLKGDNLFCIEMKKSNNRFGWESDKARLNDMVNPDFGYNYQYGFMLVVDMKRNELIIESEYPIPEAV